MKPKRSLRTVRSQSLGLRDVPTYSGGREGGNPTGDLDLTLSRISQRRDYKLPSEFTASEILTEHLINVTNQEGFL